MTEQEKKYFTAGPYYAEFDQKGKLTKYVFSEKFRILLGYESDSTSKENWFDHIYPEDEGRVKKALANVTKPWPNGPDFDLEYRLKTATGYRWVHDYGEIKRNENGVPTQIVGVVFDIDEAVRARQSLTDALQKAEDANEAKSAFLFNMSHDLRTPLNAIRGYSELLSKWISPNMQPQAKYLANINTAGQELLEIINEILEIARIENHKIVVEESPQSVRALQESLLSMFNGEAKKKHVSLELENYVIHDQLYLDRTHIQKIHMNLLGNAIKYTLDGGRVIMRLRELPGPTDKDCIIECIVEDNGIGMSEAFQKHLFEPFSRELSSTVSGIQGTGLGLSIVRQLVELMHGTIRCESQRGIGSKFFIRIPHRIAESEDRSDITPAYDENVLKGRRVLLAEDNDLNAEIAIELLRGKGISTDWARNGKECVTMMSVSRVCYDLVLMDIQMPVMDGYTAAKAIRRLADDDRRNVPIIAMTANAFREDIDKAFESGMNGHISKPIDIEKMYATIAKMLEDVPKKKE